MKVKIVNKRKFIKRIIILNIIIFGVIFNYQNRCASTQIVDYKTITVNDGDTLWKIAQYEQDENEYYKNSDIREIVHSIKEINNLKSSNLVVNQNLKIPVHGQL